MIGPLYKTYANGCWHKYTFLPRLRPYPMALALVLPPDHVCFRHMSLQQVLSCDDLHIDAMTEVSLILLQAGEKHRSETSGSGVPSSSHTGSAIPPVASADERRPADEAQPHLQRPQPGLQALHNCKHSPRYKVKVLYCCHQQLLLCSICKVAHTLPCPLKFASTSSCFTVIVLSLHTA